MIVHDNNVYKLTNLIRYSQQRRNKNESVAEHSYFVIWFVNRLCTEYEICDRIRLMALEAALLHDIPEIITNDITHDVKKMIPGIPALLQPYEEEIIREHSQTSHKVLFYPEAEDEVIANLLVKLADVLSVKQYCLNEEWLGNRSFTDLRRETEYRVATARETLEEAINKAKGV